MTRHWLICFSLAVSLLHARVHGAAVSGVVQVSNPLHSRREQKRDLQDIVVWLEPMDQDAALESPRQHVQMLQKNKMFHPHILPVEVGTVVDFPNADPIFHNAFSNYNGQIFDVALYPPGTSRSVAFRKPGVVRVFCNIHPSMAAVILVLKTAYFVKVNSDGGYRISNVPAGEYKLHSFDERASDSHSEPLRVSVQSSGIDATAPPILIRETAYVALPHKNKYGQDYAPDADSYGGISESRE